MSAKHASSFGGQQLHGPSNKPNAVMWLFLHTHNLHTWQQRKAQVSDCVVGLGSTMSAYPTRLLAAASYCILQTALCLVQVGAG